MFISIYIFVKVGHEFLCKVFVVIFWMLIQWLNK